MRKRFHSTRLSFSLHTDVAILGIEKDLLREAMALKIEQNDAD
jgi:hypothetical protein